MTPEEIENLETEVVARHADVEALSRDLGVALQKAQPPSPDAVITEIIMSFAG